MSNGSPEIERFSFPDYPAPLFAMQSGRPQPFRLLPCQGDLDAILVTGRLAGLREVCGALHREGLVGAVAAVN